MMMNTGDSEIQLISSLQNNFVTSIRNCNESSYTYSAMELLKESSLSHILLQQASLLGNAAPMVTGTLFAKRYSVFIMGLMASASIHDTLLSTSLNHVRFSLIQGGAMAYETVIMEKSLLPAFGTQERDLQFREYMKSLQSHTDLLFQAIASQTGANVKVMWALVSHNVRQLYSRLVEDQKHWRTKNRLEMIQKDQMLLFEPGNDNRFAVKLHIFKHPEWHGSHFYLRPYCCLAYQIDSGGGAEDYCTTCPKLNPEERLQLLNDNKKH
ncbi:(2Fe-2S)-binding protein [Paenibacillus qinlingensis]|uniref:Ferric iron reductase protein FhuF n=1 Tax=Paenibacillus qinlingensis TaxID=1837343 RepID=A0ABU1NS58_9BACL|nr:(2Fe-2S)-binding protein [Paenibacillus qinlingensis]MDR6550320.1 ferric iron reductase protein FhuF [Paenibacillus qinlingensis]